MATELRSADQHLLPGAKDNLHGQVHNTGRLQRSKYIHGNDMMYHMKQIIDLKLIRIETNGEDDADSPF